jgi:ankyrin repeat protein/tRNA A-37 threonylcarbamoyl transferase component Bud32
MKIQKFGRNYQLVESGYGDHFAYPQLYDSGSHCIADRKWCYYAYEPDKPVSSSYHPTAMRIGWAIDNFAKERNNGKDEDSPKDLSLKYDGDYIWIKGHEGKECVSGVKNEEESKKRGCSCYDYEVQYNAGTNDLKYFEAKDRNYLTRIRGNNDDNGELRKLEPAVWYLRKIEGAQNTDIADWWSQKLKLPTEELDKLLKKAEDTEKRLKLKQDSTTNANLSPSHLATLENDVETLKVIFKSSPNLLNNKCSLGKTPLDYAYESGSCDAITLLNESKAEETVINKDSFLPRAVETNNLPWLKLLLDAKTNANFQDSAGNSLLHQAILLDKDEIAKYLISESKINLELQSRAEVYTALHLAVKKGKVDLVDAILKRSRSLLNITCLLGKTALHYAVEEKQEGAIKILISAGADINIQDSNGLTVLHKAVQQQNWVLVDQLLSINSININLKSKDGKTPLAILETMDLFKAATNGDLVWIKRLLKLGADINSKNSQGNSILQQAILSDKDEAAKWLITESAINLNLKSKEARTALHYAALKGELELVELLIDKKVDLFVKDGLEQTAYNLAFENKHVAVAASLREAMNKAAAIQQPEGQEEKVPQMQLVAKSEVKAIDKELGSYLIEYSTLKYSVNNKLGEGGFGVVYKGEWQNIPVAIKELHLKNLSNESLQEFKSEAEIMTKLRFPNIVSLYGVCLEPNRYSMVMELMPLGSLYNLLHNGQALNWKIRYSISMDIATGLAYLHNKRIVHRDLKSPNVLLDQNLRAKLADFGLAKVRHETMTTSTMANQPAGSLAWMAPELFQRKAQYTEAADIYSTGMIFWEITSRKKPFEDAVDQAVLQQWIKDGEKETIPESTPAEYKSVLSWCWSAVKDRPTADQIIDRLKTNAKSIEQFDQKVDDALLSGPVYK